MRSKKYTFLVFSTMALLGCVANDHVSFKKDLPVAAKWQSVSTVTGTYQGARWLESFHSTQLMEIVYDSLNHNYELQGITANLDKAAAQAQKAGADLLPIINLASQVSRQGNMDNSSTVSQYGVSLDIIWEVDVWGRIRAGKNAAVYQYYAAENDYLAARLSLVAQVAKAYFLVIETENQSNLAKSFQKNLEETLEVTQAFYDEGLISLQDIHLVKADLANAEVSVQDAMSAKKNALRSLELLLGQYPASKITAQKMFPIMPEAVATGLPAHALERRPDIKSAERRVAAAFSRRVQAQAAKLPAISLTSSAGLSSDQLSTITDPANVLWNVVGNILFPIFNAGDLDADIDIRTAEQKASIAEYQEIALNAFSEAERSLDNEYIYRERQKSYDKAVENSNLAEIIADERYKAGDVDLLDLLQIKRSTITAQINQIRGYRELLDQRVNLHLALGGDTKFYDYKQLPDN